MCVKLLAWFSSCLVCRLLNLVGDIGKSYVVWEEIFDNGLTVRTYK